MYFASMQAKNYLRDKRSPVPRNENVSKVMSANKSKNTKPEIFLRKELHKNSLRGYRLNYKKVPGRPDIAFVSKKMGIFVNGCFWHRCPYCKVSEPKTNTEFWRNKFEANKVRDQIKIDDLKKMGWKSIVVWECQLKKNPEKIIKKIRKEIEV